MRLLLLLLAASLASSAQSWKGLEFLIGTWDAKTEGGSAGATASGAYTFRSELKDHVLARHSAGGACQAPTDFNCDHSDLLYIYPKAGGSFQAIYFDNEGHVIHYDITTPAPQSAVFLSTDPGPQFRLTYELKGMTISGKFQMKMPGQGEFRSYLEWSGGRKR